MARVLMPLPDRDFDPTEAAVPWRLLTRSGHEVVFATENGAGPPAADPVMLEGILLGKFGADPEPLAFYRELERAPEFFEPVAWAEIEPQAYDGLVLAGGHAPGMRQYLGSTLLQEKTAEFWRLDRTVGAICHGVLVPARARDPQTGKSLLAARRTTCLPKYTERAGYLATFWKLGRYMRTYPTYVEDEVKRALDHPEHQFVRGPRVLLARGTATDDRAAFAVVDGRYVSGRWFGDAYLFARTFRELLERRVADPSE